MEDHLGIIIDTGSETIKTGYGGESDPELVFRCVTGHPSSGSSGDIFIGDEAIEKIGCLSVTSPVERGVITNWTDVEKIWDYTFKKLRVNPTEQPVLLTEPLEGPKANREKMIQIMFEQFSVPSFYVARAPVLALYASGRVSGVVCDIGDGLTQITAVKDGYVVKGASVQYNFGGQDITAYLGQLLGESGHKFTTAADLEVLRDMRRRFAYVAQDFDKAMKDATEESEYTLPTATSIKLNKERFRCAEAIFNPSLCGSSSPGVVKAISDVIMKCEAGDRRSMFRDIVLAGGMTLTRGFEDRLKKDLVAPEAEWRVRITAPEERKYFAWAGGSIMVSLADFKDKAISRSEYDESGSSIALTKCP